MRNLQNGVWMILIPIIIVFLVFLNRLNETEKQFNAALSPHLQMTTEGVEDIIARMEHASEVLWREEAERIFP